MTKKEWKTRYIATSLARWHKSDSPSGALRAVDVDGFKPIILCSYKTTAELDKAYDGVRTVGYVPFLDASDDRENDGIKGVPTRMGGYPLEVSEFGFDSDGFAVSCNLKVIAITDYDKQSPEWHERNPYAVDMESYLQTA